MATQLTLDEIYRQIITDVNGVAPTDVTLQTLLLAMGTALSSAASNIYTVNVRNPAFGGTFNGVADDSIAWTAAILQLLNYAALFPNSPSILAFDGAQSVCQSGIITLPSNCTFQLTGKLIVSTASVSGSLIAAVTGASNVTVDLGGTGIIDGNCAIQTYSTVVSGVTTVTLPASASTGFDGTHMQVTVGTGTNYVNAIPYTLVTSGATGLQYTAAYNGTAYVLTFASSITGQVNVSWGATGQQYNSVYLVDFFRCGIQASGIGTQALRGGTLRNGRLQNCAGQTFRATTGAGQGYGGTLMNVSFVNCNQWNNSLIIGSSQPGFVAYNVDITGAMCTGLVSIVSNTANLGLFVSNLTVHDVSMLIGANTLYALTFGASGTAGLLGIVENVVLSNVTSLGNISGSPRGIVINGGQFTNIQVLNFYGYSPGSLSRGDPIALVVTQSSTTAITQVNGLLINGVYETSGSYSGGAVTLSSANSSTQPCQNVQINGFVIANLGDFAFNFNTGFGTNSFQRVQISNGICVSIGLWVLESQFTGTADNCSFSNIQSYACGNTNSGTTPLWSVGGFTNSTFSNITSDGDYCQVSGSFVHLSGSSANNTLSNLWLNASNTFANGVIVDSGCTGNRVDFRYAGTVTTPVTNSGGSTNLKPAAAVTLS